VADELLRRAPVPILLVRPGEMALGIIPEPVLDNILILLDGSTLAEQVLEPALDLARLMGARCSILRVVESRSSPAGRAPGGPPEKAQAEAYLEHVARGTRAGVQVRTRAVVARHAVEAILEEAAARASTSSPGHARSGRPPTLLLGSVADQLVRAAVAPVLVHRPTGKKTLTTAGLPQVHFRRDRQQEGASRFEAAVLRGSTGGGAGR